MYLPPKIPENEKYLSELPFKFYFFPLEVISLDESFVSSGALEEINDVRKPGWRDDPSIKVYFNSTLLMMGRIGSGTHWGERVEQTPQLWEFLKSYGLEDGDYYCISNLLPTFMHEMKLLSFKNKIKQMKERAQRQIIRDYYKDKEEQNASS